MTRIVTSDEFVTLILATLTLRNTSTHLRDAELDQSFQDAYEDLALQETALEVSSNFTFFTDPLHGNSTKLRRAIVWARDRGFLEPKQGRGGIKYLVKMSPDLANRFLASSSIAPAFLDRVVAERFPVRSSDQAVA
ncbi:hypothetical protein [Hydrogenophaga sp. ANAO-22]|uniref:hypothetical protein n=1 Tax=Hydrogenophaga sp. ANAO-22 TaxID=3166645 RepID=UPI0036D241FC